MTPKFSTYCSTRAWYAYNCARPMPLHLTPWYQRLMFKPKWYTFTTYGIKLYISDRHYRILFEK